ncbi:MAG: hypothetical protein N3D10_03470 [Candidatus Micrarchaeota archaeon]|nr:hypothetical protein [Candidatus Micrarchaeota archaeon]
MAKASKSKSTKSNWKEKSWYTVKAPEIFEFKEVGQIVSSDPENIKNRVIKTNLSSLSSTSFPAALFINVKLRVTDVSSNVANTIFIGHEYLSSYIKSLIKRRRSLIQNVVDLTTADNKKIRLKTICITQFKVSESKKKDIRKIITKKLQEFASSSNFDVFCQEMLFGKLAIKVFNAAKLIAPIKRFEIKKSELFEVF